MALHEIGHVPSLWTWRVDTDCTQGPVHGAVEKEREREGMGPPSIRADGQRRRRQEASDETCRRRRASIYSTRDAYRDDPIVPAAYLSTDRDACGLPRTKKCPQEAQTSGGEHGMMWVCRGVVNSDGGQDVHCNGILNREQRGKFQLRNALILASFYSSVL